MWKEVPGRRTADGWEADPLYPSAAYAHMCIIYTRKHSYAHITCLSILRLIYCLSVVSLLSLEYLFVNEDASNSLGI